MKTKVENVEVWFYPPNVPPGAYEGVAARIHKKNNNKTVKKIKGKGILCTVVIKCSSCKFENECVEMCEHQSKDKVWLQELRFWYSCRYTLWSTDLH